MNNSNLITEFDLFWKNYDKETWKNQPTVLRKPFSTPLVTPAEVFKGVIASSKEGSGYHTRLSLEIDHYRVVADSQKLLPVTGENNIQEYCNRITKQIEGKRFCISCGGFNADLGLELHNRIKLFLKGLYARHGLPTYGTEAVLFMGNYEITPRGIHRDAANVFLFVVEGKKRIRLWPSEAFNAPPGALSKKAYDELKEASILLEGEAGDILYWPASYWHVGDSEGALCSSISIAPYYHGFGQQSLFTRSFLEHPPTLKGRSKKPTNSIAAMIKAMDKKWLRELLLKFELKQNSSDGLGIYAPKKMLPLLKSTDKVSSAENSKIIFKRTKDNFFIAANGNCCSIPSQEDGTKLIKYIRNGKPEKISALIKSHQSKKLSKKNIMFILQRLLEWGALAISE